MVCTAFDSVVAMYFVKYSRVPVKVCNSDLQKPDLCQRLCKSLVASKSIEEHDDLGGYFCSLRSALECKNCAKGLQTVMVSGWGCL